MSRSKNTNSLLPFCLIKVMAILSIALLLSLSMVHESHAVEVPEYKVDIGTLGIVEKKITGKVVRKRSYVVKKARPVDGKEKPIRPEKPYETEPVEIEVLKAVPIERIEATDRNREPEQMNYKLSIEEIYDYLDELQYSELIGDRIYAAKVLARSRFGKYADSVVDDVYNALVRTFRTNDDEELLRTIARIMGMLGKREAGRALLDFLSNSNNDNVKLSIISSLNKLRYKGAVNQLIRILRNDDNSELREESAKVMGSIGGSSATYALISALNDEDFYVAKKAIESLGKIGSLEAKYPLMNIQNHDENLELRETAARALREIESAAD